MRRGPLCSQFLGSLPSSLLQIVSPGEGSAGSVWERLSMPFLGEGRRREGLPPPQHRHLRHAACATPLLQPSLPCPLHTPTWCPIELVSP